MLGLSRASTLVRWVESCGGALVSVVFPADCRLCKQLLTRASRMPICGATFQKISPAHCVECGSRGWWQARRKGVNRFAATAGRKNMRLTRREVTEFTKALWRERLDVVCQTAGRSVEGGRKAVGGGRRRSVPLHRRREKERGYNQVDLFGRLLARRLRLAYQLLKRAKPRPEKKFAPAGGTLGKRYVALLPWKTVLELTIPESCC
jgi:hypothetical protein